MALKDLLALLVTQQRVRFCGLVILAEVYLVLPCNTAVCDSGISTMKRVTNDLRSSLSTQQLRRLLFLAIDGPSSDKLTPDRAVDHWWSYASRKRRQGFNPWDSRQQSDSTMENSKDYLAASTEEEIIDLSCSSDCCSPAVDLEKVKTLLSPAIIYIHVL